MHPSDPPPWGTSPPVAPAPVLGSAPGRVPPEPASGPAPEPSPPPRRISGCAWVGIAAGLAVFVAVAAFIAAVLLGDDGGGRPAAGRAAPAEVEVGACVRVPTAAAADDLVTQACADPHEGEVFAVGRLDGGAFPGEAAAQQVAARRCLDRFEPYVGRPYEESSLEVTVVSPTALRWSSGDRTYLCIAHPASGADLPGGSVAGSGR